MGMMRFKVLGGKADIGDGKIYSKGEIVESDKELDNLFKNKFQRIGGKTQKGMDHSDSPDQSGKVMDDQEHKRRANVKKAKLESSKKAVDDNELDEDDLDDEDEVEESEAEKAQDDFGADVTDQFLKAADKGLSVFKSEKGYVVVKDNKACCDPIKEKKKVDSFIKGDTKKAKKK